MKSYSAIEFTSFKNHLIDGTVQYQMNDGKMVAKNAFWAFENKYVGHLDFPIRQEASQDIFHFDKGGLYGVLCFPCIFVAKMQNVVST